MEIENKRSSGFPVLAAAGVLMASAGLCFAGQSTWKSTSGGGQWSSSANWENGRVPYADDDVSVPNADNASPTYTINVDKSDVRIKSLTIHESKGGSQTLSGTQVMTFGAGGLKMTHNTSQAMGIGASATTAGQSPNINLPIHLMESQRWLLGGVRGWCVDGSGMFRTFTQDISSEPDVVWQLLGYAKFNFTAGSSADFKGSVVSGAFLQFVGTNQFSRLGTGSVTLLQQGMTDDAEALAAGTIGNAPALIYEFKPGERTGAVGNPIVVNAPHYASQFTSGAKQSWAASISGDSGRRGWCYRHVPISMRVPQNEESEPTTLTLSGGLSGDIPNADISLAFTTPRRYVNDQSNNNPFLPSNMYPFDQRIVLTGEGGAFNGAVTALTMIEIANANALGARNGCTVKFNTDGYWSNAYAGYAINGLFLRPGLTCRGTLAPQSRSDGNGAKRRPGVILLGAAEKPASAGATMATFTSDINANSITYDPLRFGSAAKGVCAKFSGKITSVMNAAIGKSGSAVATGVYGGHVDIVGWGDIAFDNAENSFDTNVCVRSGGLALGQNGAAGKFPVWLGGYTPYLPETTSVRCVLSNTPKLAYTLGNPTIGGVVYYGKTVQWNSKPGPDELDGIVTKPGDYVLVAIPYQHALNGVWLVGEQSTWTRPDSLDEADDLIGKLGTRVKVTEGKRFAGKAFMLATNPLYFRCSNQFAVGDERFNSGYGAPVFHLEGDAEPDVALKTGADGVDLTCDVLVKDNGSSGESALGSLVEKSQTSFSGTITIEKDLTLTAAKGSILSISGRIEGNGNIVGGGKGTNDISVASVAIPEDRGYRMKSGFLRVGATQLLVKQGVYRDLSWTRVADADSSTGDQTGVLFIDGNADLRNHKMSLEGLSVYQTQGDSPSPRKWPIVKASGTIEPPMDVTTPAGWTLVLENHPEDGVDSVLYAQYISPGMFIEIL